MRTVALFPGSFDPFTNGHFDVVDRALSLFDHVIVGIGNNADKKRYFELQKIIDGINEAFPDRSRVSVSVYNELTAVFAKKNNVTHIVRGLRNTTDFEYENGIAQANRYINNDLDTIFLITSPKVAYISSSIIRELHRYGEDIAPFLPYKL